MFKIKKENITLAICTFIAATLAITSYQSYAKKVENTGEDITLTKLK